MKIWRKVDLYYEPRKECESNYCWPVGEPEMTEFESAFLCGLIRERKPSRIVEVGVAAGGTTSVILKCLEMIGLSRSSEVYSVDLSEQFYKGTGERSGYLADGVLNNSEFNHKFLLGRLLPSVIDEIGEGIDFAILDASHDMPGEILDFLTIFPYLAPNACIVLHDIAYNHYFSGPFGYATQVLFSSVFADKIIMKDEGRGNGYPNIGAFVINDRTRESIVNVFNSLVITWISLLSTNQKKLYRDFFYSHYGEECAQLFDNVDIMQSRTNNKLIWNKKAYRIFKRVRKLL